MSLYQFNLPFSEIVALNILDLLKRIEKRKASLLIIDGLMGEGKTTLAVQIAQFVERVNKSIDPKTSFYEPFLIKYEDQLAMGGVDFQEKLQICRDKNLKVVIYDESGDFSKRGSITQFNQNLNRVFQTFRAYKVLVILCVPSFHLLDNDLFLQGVPRILLNCHSRDERDGDIRGYGLEEMFYLKKQMKDLVVPLKAYSMVTPNFRGHFLNLPSHLSDELDKVSTKAKTEILSKSVLQAQGLIPAREVCRKLNKSLVWVRNKLRALDIKPKKIYKAIRYYDADVVEILQNQIKYK